MAILNLKEEISAALRGAILFPGEGHHFKIMPRELSQGGYQLIANVLAPDGNQQAIIIGREGEVERYVHLTLGKYSRYRGKAFQTREFFVALPTEIASRPCDIIHLMDHSVLYTKTKVDGSGRLRYQGGRIELFDDPEYNHHGNEKKYCRIGIVHNRLAAVLHSQGLDAVVLGDTIPQDKREKK